VSFILAWLIGDSTNLLGAAMAGLLPTIIVLAAFYTLCDVATLSQIYYYRSKKRWTSSSRAYEPVPTESTSLLPQNELHWRKVLNSTAVWYILATVFVCGTGLGASMIYRQQDPDLPSDPSDSEVVEWKSQMLGWISAITYISSRVPQIIKNMQTKCSGLSMALFVYALAANITYVASILTASRSKEHLIANASWLAGSGFTVFLDLIVLFQFFLYRSYRNRQDNGNTTI